MSAERIRKKGKSVAGFLSTLALCGFLLQECTSESAAYKKTQAVENRKWAAHDTLRFDFEIRDTLNAYNFYLLFRHSTDYPYRNLWTFIRTRFPNDKTRTDTVGVILADKQGNWKGEGFGYLIDNKILYTYNRRFPIPGEYHVSIQHAMREDSLEGVVDVGLSVEQRKGK